MSSNQEKFIEIINKNPNIKAILERADKLGLKDYYLAAGCLAHSVWNHLSGLEITQGIKDYDLVYFDNRDISYEAEDKIIKKAKTLFRDLGVDVEVRNEARVHLWYKEHFGEEIQPYKSLESAVDTFPTTATTIGVRKEDDSYKVYTTYGLDDLFSIRMRANKKQITEEIYLKKVNRWTSIWKSLIVIPWDKR